MVKSLRTILKSSEGCELDRYVARFERTFNCNIEKNENDYFWSDWDYRGNVYCGAEYSADYHYTQNAKDWGAVCIDVYPPRDWEFVLFCVWAIFGELVDDAFQLDKRDL